MKHWIIVVSIFFVIGMASGTNKIEDKESEKNTEKASEKTYPKKVTSLKKRPTKTPTIKSAVEAFKDLPNEDFEFIKELDKQFKLHGDKIKIKVERDNSTLKNSKRTVDGELGYGYYNGQTSEGYSYPKPTFTFYPYSQQDIPASAPGYHVKNEEESAVSIVPSFSYELKQTSGGNYETNAPFVPSQPLNDHESYPQQQSGQGHGESVHQHNAPVIVLRIPGPTKYASHLQILLQQYLEVRAAQYLKVLEEAEYRKHQQQEQIQYEQVQEKPQHIEYQHQPEAQENFGYAAQQQEVNYPSIDDVYRSYKGRHQESHPIEEQQYEEPIQYSQQHGGHGEQQQQQQQYYYMPMEQQPAHAGAVSQGYQPIYYVAMPQESYQETYAAPVPHGYVDDNLPITENNPRDTHTKVLFTESNNKDYSSQYPLPSIKPFERHAPTPTPTYLQYRVNPNGEPGDYQQQVQYQLHGQASNSEGVVSITQRPYNYHAHSMRSKNSKRNAAPSTSNAGGESLTKLHTMINRLRKPANNAPTRTKKEAV